MTGNIFQLVLLYIVTYFVASIPTAYIMGKWIKNVDIRKQGSGNVGGSNIFHSVGKFWIVPLFFIDVILKGSIPLLIMIYIFELQSNSLHFVYIPFVAMLAHNWSPWLKFTGGRGISIAIGSMLIIAPLHLGIFTLISVGGWILFRSSGLWVLIALLFLLLMSIFYPIEVVNNRFWPIDSAQSNIIFGFFIGLIVITLFKRLFANWEKPYQRISIRNLVWNRIVYDRDMKNWKSWVHRKSTQQGKDDI